MVDIMKKIFLILILSVLVLSGCTITANTIQDGYNMNSESELVDFYGKPSVILFGATYCGHCRDAIPAFKEQLYDVYSNKINIWVNVVDKGLFDIEGIPQGFNSNLDYNEITGSVCNYVPSWVILDKTGSVVLKSCGSEKDLDEMLNIILELI